MPTHFTYLKHAVIINGNDGYSYDDRNVFVFAALYSIWIITSVIHKKKGKTKLKQQLLFMHTGTYDK